MTITTRALLIGTFFLLVADLARGRAATGGEAIADTTNVTDHAACGALIEKAVATFGRLDVLVNAAGVLRDRMIFNLSEEDWDTVVAVHLKGTYNTTRHAASYWREHKDEGDYRLINFTSGSAAWTALLSTSATRLAVAY